jgi:hypothetical protein
MIIIGLTVYFVVVSVFVGALAFAASRPAPKFDSAEALPGSLVETETEEITIPLRKAA